MAETQSLAGSFLIAMPSLADPNFWRSVVLIGVHSDQEGAFGLVVNRPLDLELDQVLSELGDPVEGCSASSVLCGGPVQPQQGFVLFEHTAAVADDEVITIAEAVTISGSSEVLSDLAHGRLPGRFELMLGYAGWSPGQLEREIEENSWLVAPLDLAILFEVPAEDRWVAALRSIGVEPGTLVDLGDTVPS